jgi:chromosome condensin MukBEF MukE localization factor
MTSRELINAARNSVLTKNETQDHLLRIKDAEKKFAKEVNERSVSRKFLDRTQSNSED